MKIIKRFSVRFRKKRRDIFHARRRYSPDVIIPRNQPPIRADVSGPPRVETAMAEESVPCV
jgi:hypothetical protein